MKAKPRPNRAFTDDLCCSPIFENAHGGFIKSPELHDTRLSRLISREAGDGGWVNIEYTNKRGRALYVYLQVIDLSWSALFLWFIFSYLLLNFLLSLIFLSDESGINDSNDDESISKYELAFFFAVQTMDTIGYGALSPKGRIVNWMVVFASVVSNFYWAVWTGIIFIRVARPSYIKYSIRFSDVACINCVESVYGGTHEDLESEYVQGHRTFSLQLADQRPNAVVCDGNFTLLYFHYQPVKGSKSEEYEFLTHELDFELNRQRGRNRSMGLSGPALSIPWKIVHKIDEVSPLFGKTIKDIKAERGEIIALLDGIDENTSENYQARWSYCGEEILEDYKFVQCMAYVKRGMREFLCCDLELLSMARPCWPSKESDRSKDMAKAGEPLILKDENSVKKENIVTNIKMSNGADFDSPLSASSDLINSDMPLIELSVSKSVRPIKTLKEIN